MHEGDSLELLAEAVVVAEALGVGGLARDLDVGLAAGAPLVLVEVEPPDVVGLGRALERTGSVAEKCLGDRVAGREGGQGGEEERGGTHDEGLKGGGYE